VKTWQKRTKQPKGGECIPKVGEGGNTTRRGKKTRPQTGGASIGKHRKQLSNQAQPKKKTDSTTGKGSS